MPAISKDNDDRFIALWNKCGSPNLIAKTLKQEISSIHKRRRAIESRYGIRLNTWNDISSRRITIKKEEGRIDLQIENGVVIVFSDAHFLPNIRTTAFRALLSFIPTLKPISIHCNGDAFDGGSISKYPRIGWDKKPTVQEELDACKDRLGEIEKIAKCDLIWELGNHDSRFECRLAAAAPEFEGVRGFTLKEHFPAWKPCWTSWINNATIINHFYHTGIHDTHNNLLKGQVNSVTGHTHSLKVTPWTNAKGETIYGVNTGTLANALDSHNVDYQHGLHGNHRSGFAVLTFRDSKLLMPELCKAWDEDTVEFRGHLLNADTGALV